MLRYEEIFGVRHAGGQRYWPGICFTELTDDFIIGHGERHVADALERALASAEPATDRKAGEEEAGEGGGGKVKR